MKASKFVGRRVIKTGIAVFITAFVCLKLDLPVIFAVITAIVTTEPTAADSIKKGFIRLPAAAIGAGLALIIDFFLGQSAATFALVAMLTISFCHHTKLDTGTLVATLTAVAMIPGSNEGLISDFIIRLSGTSIGIIISTLVNYAILPPKFGPLLVKKVDKLLFDSAFHLQQVISLTASEKELNTNNRKLHQELENAYKLVYYQQAEWQYRQVNELERKSFIFLQKKLDELQLIISHIGNIAVIKKGKVDLTKVEKKLIERIIKKIVVLSASFLYETDEENEILQAQLNDSLFHETIANRNFNPKKMLFYELLAILNCLTSLQKATRTEHLASINNENYPAYIFARNIQYD